MSIAMYTPGRMDRTTSRTRYVNSVVHNREKLPAKVSKTTLTAKGKIIIALLAVSMGVIGSNVIGASSSHSDMSVQEVTSYTVRPGDNLWTYAQMVTPEGGDVSYSVDRLMKLNNLNTPVLQAGQRIVVPKY